MSRTVHQPNAGTAAAVPAFGVRGFRSAGCARPDWTDAADARWPAGEPLAAVLLAGAGLLLGAGAAAPPIWCWCPDQVEPAAREVTLTFRITEDDPAARPARLQVFLPTGRPLVGVRAPAPPGWTARLTTADAADPRAQPGRAGEPRS